MTNLKKECEQPLAMPEDSEMNDVPSELEHSASEPNVDTARPPNNTTRQSRRPTQERSRSNDSCAETRSEATRTEHQAPCGNRVSTTHEQPSPSATKPSKLQKAITETTKALGLTSPTPLESELTRQLEKRHHEAHQTLQSQRTKYVTELQRLQKQCLLRDTVITSQKLALRTAEDDRTALQIRILELEDTLSQQERSVAEAQQRALGLLDNAEWTANPDSQTRREFNALERSIRTWSKEFSLRSVSDWDFAGLGEAEIDDLRFEWRGFAVVPERGLPLPHGFGEAGMKTRAWMFVSSWVVDFVYQEVFTNPFFFLEGLMGEMDTGGPEKVKSLEGGRSVHKDMSRDMLDLLRGMLVAHGKNANQVHTWRALTLRLLDLPRKPNMPPTAANLKQSLATTKLKLSSALSEQFLEKASRFLRSNEQTRTALETILFKATDLSFKIWTQKSYVELQGFACLTRPFSHTDERLEPCALHTQELENNESALDGKIVTLICHPAVMVYGDSEGADYSRDRKLKKAVIWAV